jgi:hypothetical protein
MNPTAAYTDQGRGGYLTWKGRWKETISWDRETMANPPNNLRCVHVTEVFGARHGWLFTDEIEPRFSVSGVSSSGKGSEEDERIKSDVQKRREEIQQLREKTNQWRDQEQTKVDALPLKYINWNFRCVRYKRNNMTLKRNSGKNRITRVES